MLLLASTLVTASNYDEWQYYKDITLDETINEPVKMDLDAEIIRNMKPDGSDIRILEDNAESAYKLSLTQAYDYAHQSSIIGSSSVREKYQNLDFNDENMIDGDLNTYFEINSLNDKESAWFAVDLKQKRLTNIIKIWSSDSQYTWKSIQVEGSNDNLNWQLIKKATESGFEPLRIVFYPASDFRYLKFTLWHTQSLRIEEIEIYGAATGSLVFFWNSGTTYKIYYGNANAQKSNYDTSSLYTTTLTPISKLGDQKINTIFNFDKDNDGVSTYLDNCPLTKNSGQKSSDSDTLGDPCDNCKAAANENQADDDKDGIGNACDNCLSIYNPDQLDKNLEGKGYVCDDSDSDGVINSKDNCITISNPSQSDKDRNGIGDACEDYDQDQVYDGIDNCLSFKNPDQKDSDTDGIGDKCDNCIYGSNKDQSDTDDDKIGDVCEDQDNDEVENYRDNCLITQNQDQKDSDNDKLGDKCDNCPAVFNPEQTDEDSNKIGDICDDADGDGIINPRDNCVNVPNKDQYDRNNDGVGYACEDNDADGVLNFEDNCLNKANSKIYKYDKSYQPDEDKDNIGDSCDDKDDRFTEKHKPILWISFIIAVAIVGFLAFRLTKKKK